MLEENHYCYMDMVFLFVPAFLYACTRISEGFMPMIVHTLYSDLFDNVYVGLKKLSWINAGLMVQHCEGSHCTEIVADTLAEYCSSVLLTLKFQIVDHVTEDLRGFGMFSLPDGFFL